MKAELIEKECKKHGITIFYFSKGKKRNSWKCRKCNVLFVSNRRRNVRKKLVEEFGGECVKCGYKKYIGALDFHHTDPNGKDFGISSKGFTLSYEKMLEEAKKCILVCSNCHREIHGEMDLV